MGTDREGTGVELETVDVADLRLDSLNPRHDQARSQREIVSALLGVAGGKIVRLADHIAANGISPIDSFLALKEQGTAGYTVLEGNRRLAALKLLANPDLTTLPKYQKRFRELSKKMATPIHEVPCAIVASRDEARPWQELRHTGEREGVGVVPWDTEAAARFHGRRGTQADRAITVVDAVSKAYPTNEVLQRNVGVVRKNRLTTLGRLVSDPFVRLRLGIDLMSGSLLAHYPSETLEGAISKIFADLAGPVSVSDVDSKEQRHKYIVGIAQHLPPDEAYESEARPLVPAGTPRPPAPKPKPTPKPSQPSIRPLFDGVRLTALGGRISAVLTEIQQLDLDRFPNASAVLLRVVIELAVTEVHERRSWPTGTLRNMVKKCVHELDATSKDPKYQAVRLGLADGTSLFSVATIHAYLHNANFNPTPTELRSIAANYSAFLAGLDTLV
jgi:hypothetical protein